MVDLVDTLVAQPIKIVGSDNSGVEQTPVSSSSDGKLNVVDISNLGGKDTLLTIAPNSTVLLKVDSNPLTNRKYVFIQSKGNQITWGFNLTTTNFDAFKNQLLILPIGENTSIFIKNNNSVNIDVAIGESA